MSEIGASRRFAALQNLVAIGGKADFGKKGRTISYLNASKPRGRSFGPSLLEQQPLSGRDYCSASAGTASVLAT